MSFNQINRNNKQRPIGKNCILVYGYSDEAFIKIDACRAGVGINKSILVPANKVGAKVRQCINEDFSEVEPMEPIDEKAIVLNAVSDYELHQFVQRFKGLELPEAIFATVTPTSVKWLLKDLLSELRIERNEMEKRNQPS